MITSALMLAGLLASGAPQADSLALRGDVRGADGAPIEGVNVFLLETLEGALTGTDGRFAFHTGRTGAATLVARRIGFKQVQLPVTLPTAPVTITMAPEAATLAPVRIQAGRWTAGDERGATLTTLEVVTTPGAAANVNRAIQTLPGTQAVDEGTALFVRGGDYTETKVLLDGAVLLNSTQLRTPTGTFVGTVDPFLLDGIFFSSGGFGARYGNALSGIASLRTLGRPSRSSGSVSAGLAAISGAVAVALPKTLGVRGAVNRHNLEPFLRLNGSPLRYDPPPVGHDLSGSVAWNYRSSGEVKLFALDQETRLGIGVDEASFGGIFDVESRSGTNIINWRDLFGGIASSLSASVSRLTDREGFGAYRLETRLRSAQISGVAEWQPSERSPTIRAGGEWERATSAFDGSIPTRGDDVGSDATVSRLRSSGVGERAAIFGETEWRIASRLAMTTGVRTDRSTLTGESTVDPRLSISLAVHPIATLTAAWGIYHQIPDPMLFDREFGDPTLVPMRSTQLVVGGQIDGERRSARIELYAKRYRDLALLTRDHDVVGAGTGTSRGVDVWLKGPLFAGMDGRLAYSFVSARRTDPISGVVARAPFDVTNSITATAERRWAGSIMSAIAYRHATGRPFTPVVGATHDTARDVWIPIYGPAMSDRLPAYHRIDISASWFRQFTPSLQGVVFWSVSNVLDRKNIHEYRYSPDYSERVPARSIFNRAHYFGAAITRL
jgi:TonB-dependent receptor-like protein/carboxypeptidase family protein